MNCTGCLADHVHHVGRMANEMDRLSLLSTAKVSRQSVAIWNRHSRRSKAPGHRPASLISRGVARRYSV